MNLREAPAGVPVVVTEISAQSSTTARRLAEMGVRRGAVVSVLRRTGGGGAILAIGDDRLALASSVLRRIAAKCATEHEVGIDGD